MTNKQLFNVLCDQINYVKKETADVSARDLSISRKDLSQIIQIHLPDRAFGDLDGENAEEIVQEFFGAASANLCMIVEFGMMRELGKYFIPYSWDAIIIDTLESAQRLCTTITSRFGYTGDALISAFVIAGECTEFNMEVIPESVFNNLKALVDARSDAALRYAHDIICVYDNLYPLQYLAPILRERAYLRFQPFSGTSPSGYDNPEAVAKAYGCSFEYVPPDPVLDEIETWHSMSPKEISARVELILKSVPDPILKEAGPWEAFKATVKYLRRNN